MKTQPDVELPDDRRSSAPNRTLRVDAPDVDSRFKCLAESVALLLCPSAEDDLHPVEVHTLGKCAIAHYETRGRARCRACVEPFLSRWKDVPAFYWPTRSPNPCTAFAIDHNRVVTTRHGLGLSQGETDDRKMQLVRVLFGLTNARLRAILEANNNTLDIDNLGDHGVRVGTYKSSSLKSGSQGNSSDWATFEVEFRRGHQGPLRPIARSFHSDWLREPSEGGEKHRSKKRYELAMLGHPLGLPLVLSWNESDLRVGKEARDAGLIIATLDSLNGYSGAPILVEVDGDWRLVGLCVGTSEGATAGNRLACILTELSRPGTNRHERRIVSNRGDGSCRILPADSFAAYIGDARTKAIGSRSAADALTGSSTRGSSRDQIERGEGRRTDSPARTPALTA